VARNSDVQLHWRRNAPSKIDGRRGCQESRRSFGTPHGCSSAPLTTSWTAAGPISPSWPRGWMTVWSDGCEHRRMGRGVTMVGIYDPKSRGPDRWPSRDPRRRIRRVPLTNDADFSSVARKMLTKWPHGDRETRTREQQAKRAKSG
jgi:hypothetical protein